MKTEKEKLIGKRTMILDRRNNALRKQKYDLWSEFSKEVEALTQQINAIDEIERQQRFINASKRFEHEHRMAQITEERERLIFQKMPDVQDIRLEWL